MTDQLERVRSLLKKVTYKPGWIINADSSRTPYTKPSPWDFERVIITVMSQQPELSGSGKTVDILRQTTFECEFLSRMKDRDIIEHVISRAVREMEMHEFDEWFKFDGDHVRDPHPENKSEKKLDKQLTTV